MENKMGESGLCVQDGDIKWGGEERNMINTIGEWMEMIGKRRFKRYSFGEYERGGMTVE